MVTEYCIVDTDMTNTTVARVNELIAQGWQPYGQLIVMQASNDQWSIIQAMVKQG